MSRPKKLWSHSVGERPHTVRVYERQRDGPLYARTWDAERRLWRKRSLGHRDRPKAKAFAHELHARLVQGEKDRQAGRVTLSEVFALYHRHKTPTKSPAHQREDRRKVKLWTRFLGPKKDPHEVSLSEWEQFKRARSEGAIDARGRHVPPKKRRKVGARVLEIDCGWLSAVFRWGTVWRLPDGGYLMLQNPVRGYPIPREKNPRRPVVTEERYRKMLAAADRVTVRVSWNGRRETVRAPFREALILTNELGRRYGAIFALRYSDILPDRGPHGSVRFRADSDKMGVESVVPMSREARRAIDHILRDRPGVGSLSLFPSPRDSSKPVSRHLASKWFRECEDEAELEHVKGLGWHGLRRKFATEMSHVPDRLVARLGGWKNPRTLDLYSQPTGTMLAEALEQRRELREASR